MQPLQFDHKIRVVSLANLKAMCERVSGMCHRYSVTKVSKGYVSVQYSNPDEYGAETPMVALFPVWSRYGKDESELGVILEIHKVQFNNWSGEGWQAFQSLIDCPVLWRDTKDGAWLTTEETREKVTKEST